ncbi:hypothetical protein CEXT_106031, partial [Caerostris extrusa]
APTTLITHRERERRRVDRLDPGTGAEVTPAPVAGRKESHLVDRSGGDAHGVVVSGPLERKRREKSNVPRIMGEGPLRKMLYVFHPLKMTSFCRCRGNGSSGSNVKPQFSVEGSTGKAQSFDLTIRSHDELIEKGFWT